MCKQEIGVVKCDINKNILAAFDVYQGVLRVFDKETGRRLIREEIDPTMTIGDFTDYLKKIKTQVEPCQQKS